MANIRKRTSSKGELRYTATVRLKGARPETATFGRLTDAKRWVQQVEAAIREGRHFKTSEAKKRTLGELIDKYVNDVAPENPKSVKKKTAQLSWWKGELGFLTLAELSTDKIGEARDKLHKGRAPATVVRYMAALSHCFTIAVNEWGWLESNPVSKVRKPKEPRGRVRYLDDDERQRLLRVCKQSETPQLYPVVVLALSTGARQSELLNLRWKDVSLKRKMLTFEETKNGERRSVPLVGFARQLIDELNKVRRLDTELVFFSLKKPSVPVAIRKPWGNALKAAEIEDFRFHDLRHSAASYLAMNGASLAEIAEILGHKTLQMVRRYAHLSEAHTSKVLESMNEGIFNG